MDLTQLKLAFVAGTLGQGGAERQLYYMLRALRQSGASVRVLCLDRGAFWEERIRNLGVAVDWVGRWRSKIGRTLDVCAKLRAASPDVVQSSHFYTNSYAAAAASVLRGRSVGALRSNGHKEASDCGRVGGWLNLHTPSILASNSDAALGYAVDRGCAPDKLFLLPSVVDTNELKPAAVRSTAPLRLLAVGRFVPAKRFDRLLEALSRLKLELDQKVIGILVGSGPLETELKAKAAALGLGPEDIEFRGAMKDASPVYREADALVITSDYEGTPNVALEAMACGLPVVATRVGGVPGVVHHGRNGLLVDAQDSEALVSALQNLATNRHLQLRLGKAGRAYVESKHSLESLPVKLAELYALARSRRSRPKTMIGRNPASRTLATAGGRLQG
jgi:glycosyltransferase involved in cell wall biosynthesis